jgi:hypothetical protein
VIAWRQALHVERVFHLLLDCVPRECFRGALAGDITPEDSFEERNFREPGIANAAGLFQFAGQG